jgi:hypothetical protein
VDNCRDDLPEVVEHPIRGGGRYAGNIGRTMATMATGTTAGITAIGTTAIGTTVGATAIGLGLVLALALTTTAAPTAIGCTATIIVAG